MRWPFGPPHLTLKPSKKTQKQKKQTKNETPPPKKNKEKKEAKKKQQKYPKIAFQLSVKILLFFGWLFIISLF